LNPLWKNSKQRSRIQGIKDKGGGIEKVLNVRVQPRASRNEILGLREKDLCIRVTAAPVDGEANRLCRKILAESLGVSLSQVEILQGGKGRRKRIRIHDLQPAMWERFIESIQER
jgi:uncharacterized protein (TIGR00251 family)